MAPFYLVTYFSTLNSHIPQPQILVHKCWLSYLYLYLCSSCIFLRTSTMKRLCFVVARARSSSWGSSSPLGKVPSSTTGISSSAGSQSTGRWVILCSTTQAKMTCPAHWRWSFSLMLIWRLARLWNLPLSIPNACSILACTRAC